MRTAVIGAGMVGLATADRLIESGDDVVVFERDSVPGGLAASFRPVPSGDRLERFYHHVFKSDHLFIKLVNDLGLRDDLIWAKPGTACFHEGRLHALNGAGSLLRFSPLRLWQRIRLAGALAILKAAPNASPFERFRSAGWLRRMAGGRAYNVVFGPLFTSKFGRHAESISLSWFWARIHDRTSSLGYPRGGFATIYERMAERIVERGGHVAFDTAVQEVGREGGKLRVASNGATPVTERFDRVVATIPLRALAPIAPDLRDTFCVKYAGAAGLAARCVILALDRPLTGVYWINVCEPDAPFTVAVEQTALVGASSYGGSHLLYLGNYGASFPKVPVSDLIAAFTPYLKRLNPAFSRAWVRDAWQFVAPDAQPIVTPGYRKRIAPHQTTSPGIFVANIYQVYPHDRGQNYAVQLADSVVRCMKEAS